MTGKSTGINNQNLISSNLELHGTIQTTILDSSKTLIGLCHLRILLKKSIPCLKMYKALLLILTRQLKQSSFSLIVL